ncbi:hypothetical protein SLE2022_261300 [Rubroshorea leprosula]
MFRYEFRNLAIDCYSINSSRRWNHIIQVFNISFLKPRRLLNVTYLEEQHMLISLGLSWCTSCICADSSSIGCSLLEYHSLISFKTRILGPCQVTNASKSYFQGTVFCLRLSEISQWTLAGVALRDFQLSWTPWTA